MIPYGARANLKARTAVGIGARVDSADGESTISHSRHTTGRAAAGEVAARPSGAVPRVAYVEQHAVTELRDLASRRRKALKSILALKARTDIEIQDVVIFVALGVLNFDRTANSLIAVQPTSISSLSDFLMMPKETVRRRLAVLTRKNFVSRTGLGFVVTNVEAWAQLSDDLAF